MKLTDPSKDKTDPVEKKEKQIAAWKAPKEGDPNPNDPKKKLSKEEAKKLREQLREQRKIDWETWK